MEKTKKAAGAGNVEEEEEEGICSTKVNQWGWKNASADNEHHYCEKHYKNWEMEKKKLPPDEQRCSHTNGNGWRCNSFRMGLGEDENGVPKSKLCEKHYNYLRRRKVTEEEDKRSLDVTGATSHIGGGSADVGTKRKMKKLPPDEHRCGLTGFRAWRCKNFRMGHGAAADVDTFPKTRYCEKHYILRAKYYENLKKKSRDGEGGGSAKIGAKRKKIETTSGELKSSTRVNEPVVELKILDQVSVELELAEKELELAKMKLQLEKKTAASDEDATEYLRNKCSDLEILVLALEIEYLTMRYELHNSEKIECEEARGLQNENNRSKPNAETSCEGRTNSHVYEFKTRENVHHASESEFPKYPVVSIPSGSEHLLSGGDNVEDREDWCCLEERQSLSHDLEMSNKAFLNLVPDSDDGGDSLGEPEDSNGSVDSNISLCDLEEGKDWGCSEDRPSQHGSSSQDQLEMRKEQKMSTIFSDLASDEDSGESLAESEDSDSSADDSTNSLHGIMDMFAMNSNEDKSIKWKSEADMLSSFEADPELCMRAVCALHRLQISEAEKSEKGLFNLVDVLRCVSLANFLMDGDGKGDLKKSIKELEKFDCEGVEDCKRLAREYSVQLFSVYQNGKDPFFPPNYNCQA